MYSSYSSFKHLAFFAGVVTRLMFSYNALSLNLTNTYLHHKCLVSQGYYKPGSVYEKELNRFISSISTNNFRSGFRHVTGEYENMTATILYQCRGDSYWSKCRPCFEAAISGLRKRCPRNKGGIIWLDQCFVKITTVPISDERKEIDYKNIFSLHNSKKVSGDEKLFNKETMALLEKLTMKANDKNNEDDGKIALYASGAKRLEVQTMYAMVQCTRFLYMPKLCKVCLETIIRENFPKCCYGKQGGRVLSTSCNFRYELYPFLRTNKTV